ncbi:MAG: DUF1616 domain-containing protein [Euryarchaeota archaeon]|nr:DUF1616 domain-containing protein [Euryarchaeota archaeon]
MRRLDRDLALAVLLVVFTWMSFEWELLRVPLGLIFVLFLPGYSLIAALFVRKADLDGIERTALSFGLSIAVVPLIGLLLNYTPFGIRFQPVAASLTLFILAMVALAQYRRWKVPEEERFAVDLRPELDELLDWKGSSRLERALTVLLVISILAAAGALVYVIKMPKEGEKFTEFYILGPGGRAGGYPTNMTLGEAYPITVGIANHEYREMDYTLEIRLDGTLLRRQDITLGHNQSIEAPVEVVPDITGEDLKLEFLLFNGTSDEPYRELHLWVDVRG